VIFDWQNRLGWLGWLPPSLLLSTLLSLIWATGWFIWRGGNGRHWLGDALVALLGFGAGQLAGWLLDLPVPAVGNVRVVEGTLLSWASLWLLRRR